MAERNESMMGGILGRLVRLEADNASLKERVAKLEQAIGVGDPLNDLPMVQTEQEVYRYGQRTPLPSEGHHYNPDHPPGRPQPTPRPDLEIGHAASIADRDWGTKPAHGASVADPGFGPGHRERSTIYRPMNRPFMASGPGAPRPGEE
jgi:hypothetical protein